MRLVWRIAAAWALLSGAAAAQPADVHGFGDIRLGMTAAELRGQLRDALQVETTAVRPRYTTHVILGRLPRAAEIVMAPDGGVAQVRIGPDVVGFSRERDAEAIESELRQSYGHNAWVAEQNEATVRGRTKMRELTWTFPSAIVEFRHRLEESAAGVRDELSLILSRPR